MQLQPGAVAPDFSLYNTDKEKVSLADYRGKTVLILFFPLAFTRVCTAELCGVRDNILSYDTSNAEVIGISVDSLYTLAKFKAENGLNFPLLSDFNKETSIAYGSLYEKWGFDMQGVSKRSAFVVDKNGILRYAEVLENAGDVPDFSKIKTVISELSID